MSSFLHLNAADFIKGLAVAVLAALAAYFAQVLNVPGFDFAGIRWDEVFRIAVAAGSAYLMKNLLSTADGKVLGKIG
jgi:hypothetical protein